MFKNRLGLFFLTIAIISSCFYTSAALYNFRFISIENNQFAVADSIVANTSTTFCAGQSVVLTKFQPETALYQWIKDGTIIPGKTLPNITATEPGLYTLQITRGSVQTTSNEIQVTTKSLPTADFSFSGDISCPRPTITFTNTSTGTGMTYLWDFGDTNSGINNTSTLANPTHKFVGNPGTGTENFTVKLTVTNSEGCNDNIQKQLSLKKRPGNQLNGPNADIYNGAPIFTVCTIENTGLFTFTNASTTKATNANYRIIWGDGSSDYSNSNFSGAITHTYNIGLKELKLLITDSNNCVDTSVYQVYVGSNPSVGLGNPGNTNICSGSTLIFPISGTSTNPAGTVYTVNFGDGTIETYTQDNVPTTVEHTYRVSSCGTTSNVQYPNSYSVSIEASNPCSKSTAVIVPVYVSEKPTSSITVSGSTTVCLGAAKIFANSSTGLKQVTANGTCSNAKSIWIVVDESGTIVPSTSYDLLVGQNLGNDFGLTDPNLWEQGSVTLSIKFKVSGKFKIKLKVGSKCGVDISEKEVCIIPIPVATFDLDKNIGCGPLVVNANNTSLVPLCGANTYQWSVIYSDLGCAPGTLAFTYTNGTSSTSKSPQFTFTNPGVYTLRLVVQGPDGSCSSSMVSKTVTVKGRPVATFTSPTSVCFGGTVNPVATIGNCYNTIGSETYLWEATGGTVANPNNKIPGSITFSTAGLQTIKLSVTNECGTTVVAKNITVLELPIVNVPSNLTSCPGVASGALTFTSTATGVNYSWTNDNTAIGLAASGNGSINSFTLKNTTAVQLIANITVTPTVGTCIGSSKQFKIIVEPASPGPAVGPSVQYCVGETASALIATASSGYSLKWYSLATGGIASNTPPVPSTSTAGTFMYYASQLSSSGCESLRVPITVIINSISKAPAAISTYNLCLGSVTSAITATAAANNTLIWYSATNDVLSAAPIPNTSAISTVKYYVSQRSSAGCESPKREITVNVVDLPGLPTASPIVRYCFGATPVQLTATVSAGNTLKWYTTDIGGVSYSSAPLPKTNVSDTVTYYVSQINSNNCESPRQPIQVIVFPSLEFTSNLNAVSICNEEIFTYQITSTQAGATISWERLAVPGLQNARESGSTQINEKLVNTSSSPVVVTYRLTAAENGCSVVREKKVTINPTLKLSTSLTGDPVCNNSTFSYIPTSNTSGVTFRWSRDPVSGITNPAASGTGNISETLINNTNAPIEVNYIITPLYSGCQGTPNAIKVTVNPGVSFTSPLTVSEVCSGTSFSYVPASNTPGAIMTWTRAFVTGISNPQASGSNTITETLINNTTRPILVSYRFKIEANNCTIFRYVPLTVNPKPKAEFSARATTGCSPFNITSAVTLNPHTDANSSYEWFANGISVGTGQTVPPLSLSGNNTELILKLVTTSKFGCGIDSMSTVFKTSAGVDAGFTMSKNEGCGPLSVDFSNSTNDLPGNSYTWDFGNGKKVNTKNPGTVVYAAHPANRDSSYYVTLTITSTCSTIQIRDTVRVLASPIAVLSPSSTVGCSPMKVDFTNHSKGTNTYNIDFGDGTLLVRTSLLGFSHTYNTTKKDTFTVKLTASNGCGTSISSYDIIVSPNSIVPELVVSGGSKFGCAPFTANFDNNSIGANKFDWDFGDDSKETSTSSPESRAHTFTKPGTYLVSLRASNACSDSTTTETITVYPPIVSSITTLKDEFCPFETVRFTTTSLADVSWLWDFGDGNTSTLQNPSHSFSISGIKNVRLTVTQAFPDGTACSRTLSKQIRVINKPQHGFSSNEGLLNCAPFNFSVNATPANSSNVEWNFGDPGSSENLKVGYTAVHTYKKPGIYTVTQIVYNLAGCTDTLRQTVRITESPELSFSIPDTTICGNSTLLDLINTSTYGGTDMVSYSWIIDGRKLGSLKDFKSSFTVPEGTALPYQLSIKLVANSTIGCERSLTRTIQFNPLPKASFTTKIIAACAPYTLDIINQSAFADQYRWYLDGILVSNEKIPQKLTLIESGKSFKLKLVSSSEFGCLVDSLEQTVTTYPKPKALFSLQDSLSCNGILDLKVINQSIGASTYNWSFGDGSPNQNTEIPRYAYGNPGVYNLRLITSNGFCADTLTKQIKVSGLVKTAFIPSQTSGCSLISVTFQNISTNADTYLWDFGDGTFSTSKNPTHNFNFTKSPYTVKLIGYGEFGCTDTTVVVNQIHVTAPPKADFDVLPDSIIKIPDYTFNFISTTGETIKHLWDFGDGKKSSLLDPTHTYPDTGKFLVTLIAENQDGCKDTIKKFVQVLGVPGHLFVPNAFEPASGKISLKTFKPVGSGIEVFRIQVFNKWGRLLWESTQIDSEGSPVDGWDGTFNGEPMPQGVYIWKIESRFINGTDWKGMIYQNSSLPHKTGSIHLIR